MFDDPLRIKRACERFGVKLSGLSAHTPLCKPEVSVEYLKQAIRFAAECGAPVVNTDEGPKPKWTTEAEDHAPEKRWIGIAKPFEIQPLLFQHSPA